MMASGDAQRIASGNLASADATALQAMLAQTEAIQQSIRTLLAGQNNTPSQGVADVASGEIKQTASSTDGPENGNMATVKDDKSHIITEDTTRDSEVGDGKPPTDESAMQID